MCFINSQEINIYSLQQNKIIPYQEKNESHLTLLYSCCSMKKNNSLKGGEKIKNRNQVSNESENKSRANKM